MQRDMDLCREILRRTAANSDVWYRAEELYEGYSREQVAYNAILLIEAGLLATSLQLGERSPTEVRAEAERLARWLAGEGKPRPVRLTWAGCEFLEVTYNETVWNNAKGRLISAVGGLPFDLLRAALKAEIKNLTGLDV